MSTIADLLIVFLIFLYSFSLVLDGIYHIYL
jgi:hypothetical protein